MCLWFDQFYTNYKNINVTYIIHHSTRFLSHIYFTNRDRILQVNIMHKTFWRLNHTYQRRLYILKRNLIFKLKNTLEFDQKSSFFDNSEF